jgi:hypothetical protein
MTVSLNDMRLLLLIIQAKCVYREVGDNFYLWLDTARMKALAMPWLRRLIADLSLRRPGFDEASVILRFVVVKIALG